MAAKRGDPGSVHEVASLFVKLGVIGFGGPAAHVALMREEVVRRRGWVDEQEFLELVGVTNLIPGPNSTELAIHLGARRAGFRGLLAAGVCFIAPAAIIVGALAWLYQRYGTRPAVIDLRYGVLPVVIAVVAYALVGLGRTALDNPLAAVIASAAFVGFLVNVHELIVLAAGGALNALWSTRSWRGPPRTLALLGFGTVSATGHRPIAASLWRLALVFVEIGSVLYGSGYVLLAFLQRNVVDQLGWLTNQQLLDAVTVGQVTPGPVFTTATFVGWQIDGVAGAGVATVAVFLPSFVFVALLGRIVPWIHEHPTARAFLAGVTAASLGLMAGVLVELSRTAVTDVATVAIAGLALVVLLRTRLNSVWLIGAGLLLGAFHTLIT